METCPFANIHISTYMSGHVHIFIICIFIESSCISVCLFVLQADLVASWICAGLGSGSSLVDAMRRAEATQGCPGVVLPTACRKHVLLQSEWLDSGGILHNGLIPWPKNFLPLAVHRMPSQVPRAHGRPQCERHRA